ncbi:hypothetical protein EXIGLDRAFT_717468 [Exidia glandulosa HHB12029]|uniref:WD40 repeat-like protein n=1 Tax=Exidia glandulosa HHB12029 TaxID=1314781 RepID=A0A165ID37_EXIGL|nr:hypothetical protein EXIGLDRAFT_717468 [Exidia glandulosa HHB12029]
MWRRVVEGWTRSSRPWQKSTTAARLSGIAFSAKGDTVVSYSAERIHLDEGESGRRILTMDRHGNAPVSVVAFSHTDRHIAEVDEHGNLCVWVINDARDEMIVRYQSAPLLYALLRSPLWLRFTPDSNHILCGNDQWQTVEFRLPPEPSPSQDVAKLEQVWPLSKKHIPSHFGWKEGDDAWLWYQSKGRREPRTHVCWLPGDRRPNAVGPEKEKVYAWSGNVVAIGASNGTLTILRVNKSKKE